MIIKEQHKTYGPVAYTEDGAHYSITVTIRHDDRCYNKHNTFSINADIKIRNKYGEYQNYSPGCNNKVIIKRFPELAPFIKWHLVSTDGPIHYIANTIYHAGNRDCHGLLKDESQQLRNGQTGQLAWILETDIELPESIDSNTQPDDVVISRYIPWCRIGEGKERELNAARVSAVWPDATDEELTSPGLQARLEQRLPALMIDFQKAVESLGLKY